ncbi:MAG: hypothetical protein KatS3mg105_0526 [Gemmatales bacterium]|nr:MAG: hypothetical protein KatS3mg105_0526 [Gemmatales bacterium]
MNTSRQETRSDVDELLERFFKSEVPSPWPRWQAPVRVCTSATATRQRSEKVHQSRFALAVTLALLFFGSLVLTGVFRSAPSEPGGARESDTARQLVKPAHPVYQNR